MKIEGDNDVITYTAFEVAMANLFHGFYGSTTDFIHKQDWWPEVEKLRQMAIEDDNEH